MPSMSYQSSTPTAWCIIYTITLLWAFSNNKNYTLQRCGGTEMWHVRHYIAALLGLKDTKMTNWLNNFVIQFSLQVHNQIKTQKQILQQDQAGGKSGLADWSPNAEAMTSRQKHIHRFWSCGRPAADCAWPWTSKPAKLSESKISWFDWIRNNRP